MKKEMTYEELMRFVHDEQNIRNCSKCPYGDEHKTENPDCVLQCDQRNCWVDVVCSLDRNLKRYSQEF